MTLNTLKSLWKDNKLAIHNRLNKATFEALKLLYEDHPLPLLFWFEDDEGDYKTVEVRSWQSLRKLKSFKRFYADTDGSFTFTLEPTEILEIFKNNLCLQKTTPTPLP